MAYISGFCIQSRLGVYNSNHGIISQIEREDKMQLLAVLGKSLGLSLGICAVVLVIVLVFSLFWVRSAVRGKVCCYFLAENKQMTNKLLKPQSETVILGKGDDATKYLIHPSKQFWSFWPPGFPGFVQEPVQTLIYVSGNVEPIDPFNVKSLISPESLRKISDEAMLKQTWRDVRETMGLKPAFGGNTLLLILVLAAVLASGIAAYLSFQNINQIEQILRMLGG